MHCSCSLLSALANLLAFTLTALAAGAKDTAAPSANPHNWNRYAAAKYLDGRQTWWMSWPKARRDHETACVSCHTVVPYAMSRAMLRQPLHESSLSTAEAEMLAYVIKRVNHWDELEPFYSDEKVGPRKTVESRGTEAVLNALILAQYDSRNLSFLFVSEKAFKNMWALQLTTGETAGSWEWLNFHNAPWESSESHYYGSALAAVAVSIAPEHYASLAEIQPGLERLKGYLRANYSTQPVANKLVVLWASANLPGLLTKGERKVLIEDLRKLQRADGGWSLTDFGAWTPRRDKTSFDTRSDGYATGLAVFALKQSGESPRESEMRRGIKWLLANQDAQQGSWPAYSLNKQRDSASEAGRFMSDAATSYAVMALESVKR